MIKEIKVSEFKQKIKSRDGDFSGYIFNFSFSL